MVNSISDNIESLVNVGGSFKMVVTGYSMLPLLGYRRDTIVVRRTTDYEDITNRIAMFRSSQRQIIVHRVVDVTNNIVTLQGDGNIYKQERCNRNDIIGVVDGVIRQNGEFVDCTTQRWHLRENIWLSQPTIVRRYALAIMRRWLNFKNKSR